MSMTGLVVSDALRPEFADTDAGRFLTFGTDIGAIDAPHFIACGATVENIKGRYGRGYPTRVAREKKQ